MGEAEVRQLAERVLAGRVPMSERGHKRYQCASAERSPSTEKNRRAGRAKGRMGGVTAPPIPGIVETSEPSGKSGPLPFPASPGPARWRLGELGMHKPL